MPHSSKRKGNRFEREVVETAEAYGLEAERAYASNGQSLGEVEECDVLVRRDDAKVMEALRIQAKRRKTVAQYLTCDGADVVVTREDRGENLVVLPLDRFLSLLKETADPLERLLNELDDRQDLSDLLDELDSGADLNGLLEDLEGRTDLDALLKELKADD